MKNNLISPRPSELTRVLLMDISFHQISPCFSFAHASCLIHHPSLPPPLTGSLLESPELLSCNKNAQNDSLALGPLCRDTREGTSEDSFPQGQPIFLKAIQSQDN